MKTVSPAKDGDTFIIFANRLDIDHFRKGVLDAVTGLKDSGEQLGAVFGRKRFITGIIWEMAISVER